MAIPEISKSPLARRLFSWAPKPWDLRSATAPPGDSYIAEGKDNVPAYIDLLSSAHDRVVLVAGVFGDFFNNVELIELITMKLNEGVRFSLLFGRNEGATSVEEVKQVFEKQHPDYVSLKRQFPDQFHIFTVAPRKTRIHFAVVDGKNTLTERVDHEVNEHPATLARYGNRKWAQSWEKRFNEERDKWGHEL